MAGVKGKSGRKQGQTIKRTREIAEAAISGGITPLEYLLLVLRDETEERAVRLDAAKASAPYIHPKLSSVEISGNNGGPIEHDINFSNLEEAAQVYANIVLER